MVREYLPFLAKMLIAVVAACLARQAARQVAHLYRPRVFRVEPERLIAIRYGPHGITLKVPGCRPTRVGIGVPRVEFDGARVVRRRPRPVALADAGHATIVESFGVAGT